MAFKYIPLIVAGVIVTAAAMPSAYRFRAPWSILAALAAAAGVVATVAGVLLVAVPKFLIR